LTRIEQRLHKLGPDRLRNLRRGMEKEGLRVNADGTLARSPHPAGLGAALTHPHITTDFSESQLELITGVHTGIDACLQELVELHQVVHRHLGDELLWCTSMPCKLPADDEIPLGRYGSSNVGRMKTTYRRGLSYRYGRRMQTISGIHYNFSLPDSAWPVLQEIDGHGGTVATYRDEAYFALIRNFRRHSWLILLLLGASPAACGTFIGGRAHELTAWESGTLYGPHATSLRMGRLGYQSEAQATLAVSFNCLRSYAASLNRALSEPWPAYEAIGLREGDEYRQLATSLLQIENEFYGTIRPKQVVRSGERPLRALGERGVEYVEVRCVDINPFHPVGIDADALRLLDLFLLHCALTESALDSPAEIATESRNQQSVAEHGRDPELRLDRLGEAVAPMAWAGELLAQCGPIADALDEAHGGGAYRDVLDQAGASLRDGSRLPSARVLHETETRWGTSFPAFALAQSRQHRQTLLDRPLAADVAARYELMAAESREAQQRIEAADDVPFEAYRQRYLEQDLMSGPHFRPPAAVAGNGAQG
jgi:glutamate--cysteine ligase